MADHGWEQWRWDPTLFEGAAPHYVRGRLPYAPGLADAAAEALGLDGTGRLLDVGCGPGIVAALLAHLFEEVVGLDPDPGMLDEARRLGVPNGTCVRARAEDLAGPDLDLGRFRVVTFAASVHWMDRPLVARAVRSLLDGPEAAAVQVDLGSVSPAADVIHEVTRRHLGPDRRAGQGLRNTSPSGEEEVFAEAGFTRFERVVVPDGRTLVRTVDDLVHHAFSASSSAPHLFPDGGGAFEADLRAALDPAGYPVTLGDNVLRIRRI
jgi:SAM-dependent methyltransferase